MTASHSPIKGIVKGIVGKVLYLRGEGGLWRSHETEGEEARFTLTVPAARRQRDDSETR